MSNEIKFDFNNLYFFVFAIVIIGILFFYFYEFRKIKKDFENKLDKNVHMISAISGYGIDKITKEILKIGK